MGSAIHAFPKAPYSVVESSYDIHYIRRGQDDHVGAGTSGSVRPCMHLNTKQGRCVKTIEKKDWWTRVHVMEEIGLLETVSGKHPNIVEYIEFFEEWGTLNLIFEYCPKGNLEQAFRSREFRSGGERLCAMLVRQIISALEFLKSVKILHRDVKPANLVFSTDEKLKLTDFGSACFVSENLTEAEGSPAFFAPEMIQLPRGKGYTFPVDMWALGISLFMMLFEGEHPFITNNSMRRNDQRSGTFDAGWLTSWDAKDLLYWMLMPHPDQRVAPDEVLNHKWFYSFGQGNGSFSKTIRSKIVLDSHGNWVSSHD
eukprot:TRINITY_DN13347_c0_g1_i1.p1 TRINITY_DN13347_c0_g1~~TRINITY_DN13347_c0_g1_i1.p1  ORF type:complete len:312 (+),score=63.58 TRINITY_DN13347_c0_g1_i1:54-989(+)